jgi:hypothetical protein
VDEELELAGGFGLPPFATTFELITDIEAMVL